MSLDVLDRFDGVADIAGQLLPAGIWILVALFGFIASMRDKSKRRAEGGQSKPSAPSLPRSRESSPPSPYAPPPEPVGDPGYGTLYTSVEEPRSSTGRRRDARREARENAEPTYGSHDKAVWRSVFDEPGQASKWGFDESEWGSSFGPKKNSEPTISQG